MPQIRKLEKLARENLVEFGLTQPGTHQNYWGARCVLQLQYAQKLSEGEGGSYDRLVAGAVDLAWDASQAQGAITKDVTLSVERALSQAAARAKEYSLLCIGHAHIDMNWMWGYDETVSVTLETFRTMLDLMNEYPEFTFGQSQASTYEIVEKHCPQMLEEIKRRVREGRWEVTASTWVESDRNMPNLESMARHCLYTKKYLSKLLDIDASSLNLDYEPDTFGHHLNVPEALADAGVKYYYHCRGHEKHVLYNWKAPSGREILAFREPSWYNWTMDGRCALLVPEFCKQHGLSAMLRVYGVGDHGGGPTRRDIEKIIDMNTWPVFPAFRFGTYGQFFTLAEQNRGKYPVVEGELNFIFDGCYTTQSRQKRGNRMGEAVLAEAEGVSALAHQAVGAGYEASVFQGAWRKVLFNQFHDILPGSGVIETREYAMGQYQEGFAVANTARAAAVRALSAASDTSALAAGEEDISLTRSEGAGAGWGVAQGMTQTGRHAGIRRLFTVYNPLPFEREELAAITVWDWLGNASRMQWTDANGKTLCHQLMSHGKDDYWGHLHTDVLVKVKVPAMGYTTIVLYESEDDAQAVEKNEPRVAKPFTCVLENAFIRAELDARDGGVISLVDKETGKEYARPDSALGVFRIVREDPSKGMSAWIVGRYMDVQPLNRGVRYKEVKTGIQYLRQSASYEVAFGNGSKLSVTVSLDAGERMLRFDTTVRWQEIGSQEAFYPQLNFFLPAAYDYSSIRYDVPMGAIDRAPLDMDVPAQSYGMPVNPSGRSLMLISDSKYGYRGTADGLSLTLLRSSVDPDPWPEVGEHHIRMAVAFSEGCQAMDANTSAALCRGLVVAAAKAHKGALPAEQSLLELSGEGLVLSAVKLAEDGSGIVVRCYETQGRAGEGVVRLFNVPKSAEAVNVLEEPVNGSVVIKDGAVRFAYRAYGVVALLIRF